MPLSKHDIAEYYADPEVRAALLSQIKNRPVMAIQTRPDKQIVRRNAPDGKPIRILKALNNSRDKNDLAWYTDRRFSEFHPSIGKRTKKIWVDIDPGPTRSLEDLKPVVTDVQGVLERMPEVKDTQISYSGGRGFYVRGDLQRKADTNDIRNRLNSRLLELESDTVVHRKPRGNEVRLDTSTLHNKGSIRADYSINSETGRVAVPLTARELRGFTPAQAEVKRILKEKEFAPGIPRTKRVYALPETKDPRQWTLAVQQHNAKKAGPHWDLRLVDPDTGFAHSWAVPKATFPEDKQKVLAIRTPTHTAHYALNFGAHGPQQIGKGYGKGDVEIVHKEPVEVSDASNNKLRFRRIIGDGKSEKFTLFRTGGDKWLFKKEEEMQKTSQYQHGFYDALQRLGILKIAKSMEEVSEGSQPLSMGDEKMPAGLLAEAIGQIDSENPTEGRKGSNPPAMSRSEQRLNRDVTWTGSEAIPQRFMDGAAPILPGRF